MRRSALLLSAAVTLAAPVAAQNASQSAEDDFHQTPPTIVITGPGVGSLDVLSGTSVVAGAELQREMSGQVGDILADLPGVSATSFSPGASRPILRGFSGERVKVLTDGLGNLDASNTSADHAVSLDPLTTERIEVLRGPAVLLYGSQAIGGAVNLIDKCIPRAVPDEDVHVDAIGSVSSVDDGREIGGSVDIRLSDMAALHFDGSYRKTDDIEIPGFALSEERRADLLADVAEELEEGHLEEAEELQEAANQDRYLPNSATETHSFGGGLLIGDASDYLGVSVSRYETDYGIPGGPGGGHHHGEEEDHDHEDEDHEDEDHEDGDHHEDEDHHDEDEGHDHGEEPVTIGLEQTRADMRAGLSLGGIFERADLRIGYSDYTHTEFEGEEVGTIFDVEGFEGRFVLTQKETARWNGSVGAQAYHRDFEAIGAEAFVAPNKTDQYALFTLQEFGNAPFTVEIAGRYEHTEVEADGFTDRTFDALSGAVSAVYRPNRNFRLGLTGSRAERAPGAEELFANGPHIATQQFEIGDPDLKTEKAWGAEAFARGQVGPASIGVSAYAQWFDDYIFLMETGEEEDELPVYQQMQTDASYYGFEAEAVIDLYDGDLVDLSTDLRADYVRAEFDDGSNVPRIPPLSLFAALDADADYVGGRIELAYTAEQDEVTALETPTDDFLFVNAAVTWRPLFNRNVTFIAQMDNIFDVEGRRHASFTKDYVPLPGRDIRVSARLSF
ncbi:TonB-dependent receptor [Pacificimonas flava]|uniref:TonB-dependent receptor n=2 Tax=Pacificimonas TaxID=1960290 RepID=A0A219B642_9SPHN|nr:MULTISPECIES: TonB-dependent receptor [Pacificimonas]MBZ6378924.1 TonB-dependent receptor [Pacificimonas aurantium]OWV33825.1 TonB-dependent receptor [Pacificimonas flava]